MGGRLAAAATVRAVQSSLSTYLDVVRSSRPAPAPAVSPDVSAHAEVLAAVRDGSRDLGALRSRLPDRSLASLLGSLGWLGTAKLVDVDISRGGLRVRLTPLALVELAAPARHL